MGFFDQESGRIVPILLDQTTSDAEEVRQQALLSLGRLGRGMPAAEEVVRKYEKDQDPVTRQCAVVALAGLGKRDEVSIPILFDAAGSKDEGLMKAANQALSELGKEKPDKVLPGLLERLESSDQNLLVSSIKVLRLMKSNASPALPRLVAMYDSVPPKNRIHVIEAVTALDGDGRQAVLVLTKALDEPEARERREALLGLMKYRARPELIVQPLIKAISDKDNSNKLLALGMIKGLGKQALDALPALIMLTEDPETDVRSSAVTALGAIQPPAPEIVPVLKRTVSDNVLRVRLASVAALERVAYAFPDEVLEILRGARDSEKNERAKTRIVTALQFVNQKPAGPPGPPKTEPETSRTWP